MRIACPACAAEYEVADRLIGAGRRLQCARCGHGWHLAAPTPDPSPAPAAAPPEAVPGPAPPRRPPAAAPRLPPLVAGAPPPRVLWLAWLGSVLAVAGVLAGLLLFRPAVTAAWPPMARLYHWIGLGQG